MNALKGRQKKTSMKDGREKLNRFGMSERDLDFEKKTCYVPRMSFEEERKIIVRAKAEDKQAISKLIQNNMRVAFKVAKFYYVRNPGSDVMDLVNAASIGMIRAIPKFDLKTSYRFSTYAMFWARAEIQKMIVETLRMKGARTSNNWLGDSDVPLSLENIKSRSGDSAHAHEEGESYAHRIPDEHAHLQHEMYVENVQVNEFMTFVLDRFKEPVDKMIIVDRIMQDEETRKNLKDIAEIFSCSRETIRKRETEIKKMMAGLLISFRREAA